MHPREILPGLPPRSAEKLRDMIDELNAPERHGGSWPIVVIHDATGSQWAFDMTYEDWRPWLGMPAITANTDDLDIFNFNWLLISLSADWNLTGMQRGRQGVKVLLTNTSSTYSLTIKNLATGSQTWNQFMCAGGIDYVLGPGQTVLANHDGTVWWVGQWAGGDSPVFGGPMTVTNNVFIQGAVVSGITSVQETTLVTNLTQAQIEVLDNLNACQTQALLTLTTATIQSLTINLTAVDLSKLFASITVANVSIVTTLITTWTTTQIQTFTTYFDSSIFINTGVTTSRMLTFIQNVTSANIAILTGILSQEKIAILIEVLTDAQMTTLITNLTGTQFVSLVQYTSITISNLVNKLTTSVLQTFLNTYASVIDLSVFFNVTTISNNTTNTNVTAVNVSYIPFNPTGSSATLTSLNPTSPSLAQTVVVLNLSSSHNLLIVNSGAGTYPIKVPTGGNYSLLPGTSVSLIFDPTLALWVVITAPTTGGTGGLVKTTNVTSGMSPYSWTPQADTAIIVVEVFGDGAGGGGAAGGSGTRGAGGGGGAGAYAKATIPASTYSTGQTVTVGSGGSGGSGAAQGNSGTGSSFGTLVECGSGTGGTGGVASSSAAVTSPAPGGGVSGSWTPDVSLEGGAGDVGLVLSATVNNGGAGGACGYSQSAGPTGNGVFNGTAGINPGSGGSGAAATTADKTGGAGAPGLVVIYEYTLG
jgi:hypothetical protein